MNPEYLPEWIARTVLLSAIALAAFAIPRHSPVRWLARFAGLTAFLAMSVTAAGFFLPLPKLELVPAAQTPGWPEMGSRWLVWIWGIGVVLLLVKDGMGWLRLRATIRGGRPLLSSRWIGTLRENNGGGLLLVATQAGFAPAAAGLMRPVILVPMEWERWSDEERKMVLSHEIAHVRRGDLWLLALARFACALSWFNPGSWLLLRLLAVECEHGCDRAVLAGGIPAERYAGFLVRLALRFCREQLPSASAFARESSLRRRVSQILEGPGCRFDIRVGLVFCTGILLLLGACAFLGPKKQAAPGSAEVELRLAADPFPGE